MPSRAAASASRCPRDGGRDADGHGRKASLAPTEPCTRVRGGRRGRACPARGRWRRPLSAFRTWNGVDPWRIFPTVDLHAIAGDQVFLGRVTYEPGTTVQRHSHEHTEQVMLIVEGSLEMTIGDETRTMGPGDVCVVNRGVEHELTSGGGVTFIEALAPVPLDHIPDRERDLVLGDLDGSLHVER